MTQTTCRECGTTRVTWKKNRADKWVMHNTNGAPVGVGMAVYGPHFLTCQGKGSVKTAADRGSEIIENQRKDFLRKIVCRYLMSVMKNGGDKAIAQANINAFEKRHGI